MNLTFNPRLAAFEAVYSSFKGVCFAEAKLKEFITKQLLSKKDYRLAQEIAFGTIRMKNYLDERARLASKNQKLKLSLKQKCLLWTALYQLDFLTKVPSYAAIDESVSLANQLEGKFFARFLNALLRAVSKTAPLELKSNSDKDLSLYFSFPESFIHELKQDFGDEKRLEILNALNHPAKTMARIRKGEVLSPFFQNEKIAYSFIEDVEKEASSKDLYIQNATPGILFDSLFQGLKIKPLTILDMCSSPGGKLLLAHDFFPKANLFANDVSLEKIQFIKENALKYDFEAVVSEGPAESYSHDEKFDLIIVDAPCSNTGVFNKRAEARWRFSKENLNELKKIQLAILQNAARLLKPDGELWYMTCSILKEENEKLVSEFTCQNQLKIRCQKTVLPTINGFDGGFAAALSYSGACI